MTLAVPSFAQSQPHTCLPACVRMILAYHGYEHAESDLTKAFKTVPLLGWLRRFGLPCALVWKWDD